VLCMGGTAPARLAHITVTRDVAGMAMPRIQV